MASPLLAHIDNLSDNIIEKLIPLDGVDLVEFCGANNSNIGLLRHGCPQVNITLRGAWVKVTGDSSAVADFDNKFQSLLAYYREHNTLPSTIVEAVLAGRRVTVLPSDATIITYTVDGRPVKARGLNQQRLVEAMAECDMAFAVGPAGSGKTYIAIALAVSALKSRQVRKIILSRPAVEAGEKLGFLPGDMKDKIDPYLQPLYDALEDMIPTAKLKEYMETKVIQIAPLAFMRGRTLNDAVIILDEAQNTTTHQIKMFMTRLGLDAKMIITGDVTQIDLPRATASGLVQALRILDGVKGVGRVEFDKHDIVRHQLVQRIVEAYERHDAQEKAEAMAAREAAQTADNNADSD